MSDMENMNITITASDEDNHGFRVHDDQADEIFAQAVANGASVEAAAQAVADSVLDTLDDGQPAPAGTTVEVNVDEDDGLAVAHASARR